MALALIIPLGALLFDKPIEAIGVVALVSATLATGWNYLYNLAFDHALQRRIGHTRKAVPLRIVHAILFEAGLLLVLIPFIAWYLEIPLWDALLMDVSFTAFYLVYAFGFNWAYDVVFPVPETTKPRA